MKRPDYPRYPALALEMQPDPDFIEPDNPEFGTDLLPKTREFLANYDYLGVRPREIPAPQVPAGVIFFTADIKLPEQGEAKLLEFNGAGSRLEAYPGGEEVPVHRIYRLLNALNRPITVLSPLEKDRQAMEMELAMTRGSAHGIRSNLIGCDIESAQKLGIKYTSDPKDYEAQQPVTGTVKDLRAVDGVVWLLSNDETVWGIDTSRFTVINPSGFNNLIDQKVEFCNFFREHGLEFARPKSWLLSARTAEDDAQKILIDSEGVEKFILKPSNLSGGQGIELIERSRLIERIRQLFIKPFDYSSGVGGQRLPPEGYLRRLSKPFVIEEYCPSKPILSKKTGELYDGTMRIALMAVTNNERTTLVPICGYWKLPKNPIGGKWDIESTISDVHQNNPSERVSPEDFERGFRTLTIVMPELLRGTLISQQSKKELTVDELLEKFRNPSYLPTHKDISRAFEQKGFSSREWMQFFYDKENPVFELLNEEFLNALCDYLSQRAKSLGASENSPVTILEIGAGNGRLSHLLQQKLETRLRGQIRVIATDSGELGLKTAFPVETIDYKEALQKYQPRIVICSWMPPNTDFTDAFRATTSVDEYMLIGETDGVGCGDQWRTWGLGDEDNGKDEVAPYIADGFKRVDLDNISKYQICRTDQPGEYCHSRTTSFQRQRKK